MTSIVAIDLETTGLDPKNDVIIEIGAIRFNDRRIEDEFSTLINPGRAISPFITKLTGINNAMVRSAPIIEEVIPGLENFVQNLPILGHNVKFDVSFLNQVDLFKDNETLDTYDMASVLLPDAGRYNLGALGQLLDIPFKATHRALDDAKVTQGIYIKLFEEALNLPLDILAEIVRLGEFANWGAERVFKKAFNQRNRDTSTVSKGKAFLGPIFQNPPPEDKEPLIARQDLISLDIEEVSSLLEHGGEYSKIFPHFEHRPEQIELCQTIANTLSEGYHLLAESGTGTGKSMAYLIPAAIWALKNTSRVIISTNTINLQDQLINKDIPDVKKLIGSELKASVLKGRNNYLCPRRLEAFRKKRPESADEIRVLSKMLIWLSKSETGDLSEININGPRERAVWNQISANDDGCTTETCIKRMGGICPIHRAKQAANQAHVLVVNHALLLADVATGNRILPDYNYLIVDEAHHLESATTNALSFRVTQSEIERTIKELGGSNSGLLGRILKITRTILEPGSLASLNKFIQQATDKAFQYQNSSKNFFIAIGNFLEDQREGRKLGTYSHRERIISSTRTLPSWLEIEISWEETQNQLSLLFENIERTNSALAEISDTGQEEIEDLMNNLTNLYRRLSEYENNINGLVFEPVEELIYWVEINPNQRRLILQAAPLHIGNLMEEYLWHEKSSVTLTSATLTTNNNFDYIRKRLNAWDADELSVGSPFDYENSTLLYIPNNIPEPSNKHGHQKAVENGIIKICAATGGKALFLFTSYAQLQTTSKAISNPLANHGITVFEQGQGASPHALIESFKSTDQAVLLGTRAFWEGIDIPGEDLSILGIVKLPFGVPSDPIIAARSETFEQPFYEYSIPEAIISFRQGFGRLIRNRQDRGVVVMFDNRVLTKQYGKMFLDSLPPCTVEVGPLEDIPKKAVEWLGF